MLEEQAEFEEKYPGLLKILMDPYGSLYLNEDMYKVALRFLADCVKKNEGELPLAAVYVPDSLETQLIQAALVHLLPGADAGRQESFLSVLEACGVATGMYDVPGWDVHLLNKQMIDTLEKYCKEVALCIETKPFYRWSEEHKQTLSVAANSVTDFAFALAIYNSIIAGQNQVCMKDTWLKKGINQINKILDNSGVKVTLLLPMECHRKMRQDI